MTPPTFRHLRRTKANNKKQSSKEKRVWEEGRGRVTHAVWDPTRGNGRPVQTHCGIADLTMYINALAGQSVARRAATHFGLLSVCVWESEDDRDHDESRKQDEQINDKDRM